VGVLERDCKNLDYCWNLTSVPCFMYNSTMSSITPYETGIARIPQLERAMAWLVEVGPLVEGPPLPVWILSRLVKQRRILRLRRDLYLVPRKNGKIPSETATIGLVFPEGYITGMVAHYNFTDQDAGLWHVINPTRMSGMRYGPLTIEAHCSPKRISRAKINARREEGVVVGWATPVQAIIDCCALPSLAPEIGILIAVMRTALQKRAVTAKTLQEAAMAEDSEAVATRIGYLLELLGGEINPELWKIARRTNNWLPLVTGREMTARDSSWRILLPESGAAMLRRSL